MNVSIYLNIKLRFLKFIKLVSEKQKKMDDKIDAFMKRNDHKFDKFIN